MPVLDGVFDAGSHEDRRPLFDGLPDLLTAQDVCDLTGASLQTVRRACAGGQIPAVRIGRRWYVPRTRFADYCEGVCHG